MELEAQLMEETVALEESELNHAQYQVRLAQQLASPQVDIATAVVEYSYFKGNYGK